MAIYYVLCDDDCRYEGMTKEQILTSIAQAVEQGYVSDPDSAVFSQIKEVRAGEAVRIWVGTEAEFNAISPVPKYGVSFVRVGEDGNLYLCSDDSLEINALPLTGGSLSGSLDVGGNATAERLTSGVSRLDSNDTPYRIYMQVRDDNSGAIEYAVDGLSVMRIMLTAAGAEFLNAISVTGGASGAVAEQTRANLGVPPADMFVLTDVDPGAGSASEYPDGTRIDVYE